MVSFGVFLVTTDCRKRKWSPQIGLSEIPTPPSTFSAAGANSKVPLALRK
jgi:hypothetical protein